MADPICGRCLHVKSEHQYRQCLPTLAGGSSCNCPAFIDLTTAAAESLRMEAAELIAKAKRIERFGRIEPVR